MLRYLKNIHRDQGGNVFVETALLILGISLAVAPYMVSLGSTLGGKVDDIRGQVEQVGE